MAMNLETTLALYCDTAGSQATSSESNEEDAETKALLNKKQTRLNKLRKSITPAPEDGGRAPVTPDCKPGGDCNQDTLDSAVANEDDLDTENQDDVRKRKPKRLCTVCSPGTSSAGFSPVLGGPVLGRSAR